LGFREDIPQILDSLDIYVQSSKREGLPIVLLEAMAAGKAIVSTKAGGIPGVIEDGKQGCLVEIGDVEQLAHVLDRVVKSADERRELGRQARHLVEAKFSAGTMAEKYLAVYRG
jgi:glycosyltransferase involved in cell wall biosynthesis